MDIARIIERDAVDAALARRLVDTQFPRWADLAIRPVEHAGWDNRTFRLGDDLLIRLPTGPSYAQQVAKEQRWLPELAPHLPLPIPEPVAGGRPDERYPFPWSVYRWLPGRPVAVSDGLDLPRLAADLAGFLAALYAVAPADGPPPGEHNFFRGAPPDGYDAQTRAAIDTLGAAAPPAALEVWEAGLGSRWTGEPVWFHGDVAAGNLLARDGRLSAVIDFGTSGVGDPACDLAVAWTLFDDDARTAFRARLGLDTATWARGRAWTVWKALITLADGADDGDDEGARRALDRVVADHVATERSTR